VIGPNHAQNSQQSVDIQPMAEELKIDPSLDRASAYRLLLPQVAALIKNKPN